MMVEHRWHNLVQEKRAISPFPFSVRKIKRPKNASYKGYFSDDLHFSDAGVRKIQVSGLFFGRFSIFRTPKGKEAYCDQILGIGYK